MYRTHSKTAVIVVAASQSFFMRSGIVYWLISLIVVSPLSAGVTDYVNPFIGTTGGGNTHPGAMVPWGMVSAVPFNIFDAPSQGGQFSTRGTIAYEYGRKLFTGFTQVNLSGVGCPDLGNILVMPISGDMTINPEKYASPYGNQIARPGYYAVDLLRYNIKAEGTVTPRSLIYRFSFPKGQAHILFNLGLNVTQEKGGLVHVVSPTEIEGFDLFGGFCFTKHSNSPVYFVAQVDTPATSFGTWNGAEQDPMSVRHTVGDKIGAYLNFDAKSEKVIQLRIGISYVSIENARLNLHLEQQGFQFDLVQNAAQQAWENELSNIKVEGGSDNDKRLFYTAFYHILMHPNIFQDVNGEYIRIGTQEVGYVQGRNKYTVFSLWDTYRNVHPFLSLLFPRIQVDMVNSMLDMYQESGWLPKWELAGKETYVMVGDPATIVIADTYLRGLKDFDSHLALQAMLASGSTATDDNWIRPGLAEYRRYGYIPHDKTKGTSPRDSSVWGSVSTTLEYALADWCVSQFAESMGEIKTAKDYAQRSQNIWNLFDSESTFFRPRLSDQTFVAPQKGAIGDSELGMVEGTAWQYNFFVPHAINDLIKRMGKDPFVNKLQRCFDDHHYALWNEPDMAFPYLFNYVPGEEWRSQKVVSELIKTHFSTAPNGLPGNDDCGTTSAWLLLSMLGLYPDCPGKPDFALVCPIFDRVTLTLDGLNGEVKPLVIEKKQGLARINRIMFKGKRQDCYFISHQDIAKGGKLTFE